MELKRLAAIATAAVMLFAAVGIAGCAKKVTVTDGDIVLCTEGHVISDNTKEIEVPASQVSRYTVETRTETCELHKDLAALMAAARKALDSGDTKTAQARLEEILARDPNYRNAADLLTEAKGGGSASTGKSGSQSSSGGTTDSGGKPSTKPGEDTPTGPVMNLVGFVPDKLTGFAGQGLIVDPFVLTRMYIPTSSGAVRSLTIVAEQFKDAKSATAALNQQIKSAYPESAGTVKVGGRDAYFGAREDVAAVAFVSGNVLVVAEGVAVKGSGATAKSTLTKVAEQIAR